jgi:hypothetical protein
MTNETAKQRDTAASDTQKASSGCGAMMAEMMKKHGARKDAQSPASETGQPLRGSTQKESGCGCGAMMERMMGKYFKDAASEAGERH